ncbi:GGDEF domain-containing protein [Alkalicoccus luteus]|uniref:Diguanylate cyclase n=1 Tax=Alkalicoccus luteus TaxID=1237094 RepID=A0A969PXS1_9BACI|nr:diguanylate cyclase [Alkalicoccus luteus]NJP37547.1 diguanylate cyclase [Alkalicoccus luteus]
MHMRLQSYVTKLFIAYMMLGVAVGIAFSILVPAIIAIPDESRVFFTVFAVSAGVLLGLLNFLVARQFIVRCTSMFQDVLDRVRNGDYTARSLYAGSDVVRSMSDALNRTITSLEQKDFSMLHDRLTGLPNREALDRMFAEKAGRRKLFFIDLDQFKKVNDSYGHAAGDQLLQDIAKRLQQLDSRLTTRSFRYGGDEFIVIADEQMTEERLNQQLVNSFAEPFYIGDIPYQLKWSLGSHSFEGSLSSYAAILEVADQRMYQAKQTGARHTIS